MYRHLDELRGWEGIGFSNLFRLLFVEYSSCKYKAHKTKPNNPLNYQINFQCIIIFDTLYTQQRYKNQLTTQFYSVYLLLHRTNHNQPNHYSKQPVTNSNEWYSVSEVLCTTEGVLRDEIRIVITLKLRIEKGN